MHLRALWVAIAGEVSWVPPGWARRLGAGRLGLAVLAGLALSALGLGAYGYLQGRPKPLQVGLEITPPGISAIVDDELVPELLRVQFVYLPNPDVIVPTTLSAARIDLVGEVVPAGVDLDPAVPGKWRFETENLLTFQPEDDWPAGQEFRLRLGPGVVAPQVQLATREGVFTTAAFDVVLTAAEFYQDPVTTGERKVVASLEFSHPVDRDDLQRHLALTLRESGEDVTTAARQLGYRIDYGVHDRSAHVHSDIIALPERENYVTLNLDAGLVAVRGPAQSQAPLFSQILIPDRTSYFRVEEVLASIAMDDTSTPIQTLSLNFTDRVNTEDFSRQLEVYLLPANRVTDGRSRPYRWRAPREVTADILAQSERVAFSVNATELDSASLQSASLDLAEGRSLYVRLRAGLASEGGFTMASAYDTVLQVPAYPKEAKVAQDGALLPLTGSRRLTLVSRGVETLRIDIQHVLADEVNHLASQTGGDIRNPYFVNYNFDADNIASRTSRFIDVNTHHPREQTFASLDLGPLVKDGGLFFVEVRGWDRKRKRGVGAADRRFVLVTDLGLLAKTNADNSQDLFVHSVASGVPVAGARVELLGKNGIPVLAANTDADGHVQLPAANNFERERSPTAFLVRQGDDITFMPYQRSDRQLTYSGFDIGGEYVGPADQGQQLKAALYTDRGIYRPGETAHIFGILRREDFAAVPGVPLELRVFDPRGTMVLRRRLKSPSDGFLSWSYESQLESATGSYQVSLYLVDEGERPRALGGAAFSVEEFQPDRMRIRASIDAQAQQGWLTPGSHQGRVYLENLFGTPAQARRVRATLQLVPTTLQFENYKGYVFVDPFRAQGSAAQPVTIELPEVMTDSDGVATLGFDLSQYDRGIYRMLLSVEGFEAGAGRSVQARASAMMSPLRTVIGYKADGDLSFVARDSDRQISFVALDQQGQPGPLNELDAAIYELRYVSALVKRPNGTFAYQSVLKENLVSRDAFAVPQAGRNYAIPTQRPGRYLLKLIDDGGLTLSRVEFTVAGAENLTANLERNAELDIKLDRSDYGAGDEITLEITAPYAGTGLITIERERVHAYKWFRSATNTTIQRIRVPAVLEGNAYVNVAFVRAIDSEEIYVSPLSYAVAPFAIDRAARRLEVDLEVPKRVRPGDELVVGYKTSGPARLVLYAVDEGILQVASYQNPDPLEFFLRKKALQVATHQMVDLILPDYDVIRSAAAPGGGDGAASLLGGNLNPFQRHTDAPAVFYSGLVDSGVEQQQVRFRVPDYFNGEVRVLAVAASTERLGSAQAAATVRGPFVLTPNFPTAVAPGDEFEVSVGIANNVEGSGTALPVKLAIVGSSQLEVLDSEAQTISIDEGGEGRVVFRVRAAESLGAAALTVSASAGDQSLDRGMSLSIRPAVPFMTSVETGFSAATGVELALPRRLHAPFSSQRLSASASPLVLAHGMLEYLQTFPHACVEQIVSKIFPQVGLLHSDDFPIDRDKFRELFDATIFKLRSRQHGDGGFRFWVSSVESAPFPSVYIAHFLTDAREQGLSVPGDMLNSALGFLRSVAAEPTTTLEAGRTRAYAVYVLTRNGEVTTNYLNGLQEGLQRQYQDKWQADITAVFMAAAFQLLKNETLAQRLVGSYRLGEAAVLENDFDTRLGNDAQYLYLVARHFPARLSRIDGSAFRTLMEPVFANRFNTLSSAYTILALGAYHRQLASRGAIEVPAITAWGDSAQLSITGPSSPLAAAVLPNASQRVKLETGASDGIYFGLTQSGFDLAVPAEPLAQGIEVARDYLNDRGEPVVSARVGDELTVRLRVRSLAGMLTNVAVTDLLPGGFEILTESVRDEYSGWSFDYRDIREDRLVVYGSFGERMTELRYRVKLTSPGDFVVPAAYAASMYHRDVHGRTAAGRFAVASVP